MSESANSPTTTLKNFIEASKTKDIETIKKLLSKSTIESIKKAADAQSTTVDEILLDEILLKDNGTPLKELPETRNEIIEGETAAVEVKNKITGEFETIPFVKEDSIWKIALDKFMRDLLEKQKQTADAPSSSADNPAANKSANNNK
ncbi:MAG: hypothetical protein ABI686_12990 [Acidobacteriota bacterium]